ncbi:MAG: biotin/lipoyl-containing protein [Planctomycetaceae bacterium]|nr:biotin/lipoyl-containing protein [Planctomycetaceae bacterium]
MSAQAQRCPIQFLATEWGTQPVRIVNWLVEKGETVMAGDVLVEIGLPGILGDVRAATDGRVTDLCRIEDEWVTAETVLGWLEPSAE